MSYELLSKLYYKNPTLYEIEYEQRKNSPYSVSLGFDIAGGEAFYVQDPEFINQTTRIYKKFAKLSKLCAILPGVAYTSYARKCLIDEIILTNDIEGIRSTRKEVLDVLTDDSRLPKKKRFDGLIRKYVLLLEDADLEYEINLKTPEGIRALYNDIVIEEVDKSDWPDGEIFRKEIAEVISATQQVKHVGLYPESKIIRYVNCVLALANHDRIPMLHYIAILHYMIGYIHPFYDGNGRLSRFMSSALLKDEFNALVAFRLAYTIKNSKSDYYKAFDIANDPNNKGDLTHFILYFCSVVEQSLDSLIEKLTEGKELLEFYWSALSKKYANVDYKERKKTKDVLWLLVQNSLFSNEPFSKKELSELLETSASSIHRYIEALICAGAPISIEKESHRFVYVLDKKALLEYLNS